MSEEMTRKEIIWQLKGLLLGELRTTAKERKALEYAISSLETDEAYNLMYEKPEFCENCIDREYLIKDLYCKANGETSINIHWFEGYIKRLPSVLPKATKNDLAVDCISRADAIKAMQEKAKKLTNEDTINGLCGAVAVLFDLPPATPQEPKSEWEHDHEILKAYSDGANEVIDKIRADINIMPCAITSMKEIYVNRDKVINILDKYKAESEKA